MPYAGSNPFFSPEGRPKPFPGVKRDVLDGELTTAQTFKAGFERRKVFQFRRDLQIAFQNPDTSVPFLKIHNGSLETVQMLFEIAEGRIARHEAQYYLAETEQRELHPGGRERIRTSGRIAPTPDFESGAFNHSATLPAVTHIKPEFFRP